MLLSEKPEGSAPEATDHEYGVVPPFALIVYAYDAPDCAPGTEDVVMVNGVVTTAGFTETLALAFFVVSAALVTVMVTVALEVTVGAVNIPFPEIDPAEADHVTDVLLVPWTEARNCWPFPEVTVADEGEIKMPTVVATGATVTTALALFVLSAVLVARTVMVVVLLTLGAVKTPALVMLPAVADQLTAVLSLPCTVAENSFVLPELRP